MMEKIRQLFKNKIFLTGTGLLVLVGLGIVLGLAVMRIQQPKPTVIQPKAAGTQGTWEPWPDCINSSQNTYKCSDPNPTGGQCTIKGVSECCAKLGAGGSIYECSWPNRGWCTPEQCAAATPNNDAGCNPVVDDKGRPVLDANGNQKMDCNTKRGHCGLYWYESPACSAPMPTGKAGSPSPVNGEINVSTKPVFLWSVTGQGTVGAYVNVYIWSCQAMTDDCMLFGSVPTPPGNRFGWGAFYREVEKGKGTTFAAASWNADNYHLGALMPNTKYWWKVTPGISGGVQFYADVWTFTTGVATAECPTGQISCNNTCINPTTDANNCGGCGTVCSPGQSCVGAVCTAPSCPTGQTLCSGACKNLQTDTSNCGTCGHACTTGQVCSSGVCTTTASECTTDSQCPDTKKCTNGSCVGVRCPRMPTDGCWSFDISNHACNRVNEPDGTACTAAGAGSTCQNGVCTAPLPTAAKECEVCEGFAGKTCATGLTCKKVSGAGVDQGGVCVKTDGSSVCGTCTSDSNCTPPLVCANQKCVEPSNSHLACVSNACARVIGSGSNTDGCITAGKECTTQINEPNACWGNGGVGTTAGRCYDCNGDGEVNILDFSCFRAKYQQNVQ